MVIIAGWVFWVSFNFSSGPFNIILESENPRVLSTVSKIALQNQNSHKNLIPFQHIVNLDLEIKQLSYDNKNIL